LTQKAIEKAIEGDTTALRLCLDRLAPPRKDRHITIDLPRVRTAADAVAASATVVGAVAAGELTPGEGEAFTRILDSFTKALEASDLEERLARLEAERGDGSL
jgi:hypothetical protein